MGADPVAQRVEVEPPERPRGVELRRLVGDEEFAVDEEDVRLDAGEALVEGVEQRPGAGVEAAQIAQPVNPGLVVPSNIVR